VKIQFVKIVALFIVLFLCNSCLTITVPRHELQVGKSGYPYSTINKALNVAKAGDTIRIMDGETYSESLRINVPNLTLDLNGSILKENTIEIWDTSHVTIENGTITNVPGWGIDLEHCSNCNITNMTITMNEGVGIFVKESSFNTIENCVVEYNKGGGAGIDTFSNSNRFVNNIVRNCSIGLWVYQSSNLNEISKNVITDNKHEHGINIGHNSNENKILENIVERNESEGIILHDGVSGNLVAYNSCVENHRIGILLFRQANNNIVRENTVLDNWEGGIEIKEACNDNLLLNNIQENNDRGDRRDTGQQDDAGLGRDATNKGEGDPIPWGNHRGYLSDVDVHDWYKVFAKAGKDILIRLVSPPGSDFDLVVMGRELWKQSNKFQSLPDEILCTPKVNRFLTVCVQRWAGEGEYSLVVKPVK
jgi:parallel beta-helix repeat protein